MSATISFHVSQNDRAIITEIARRAAPLYQDAGVKRSLLDIQMDIEACHANGCPLRLSDLLAADDFNFMHDVAGIARHVDHDTGRLRDCFVPRFAAPQRGRTRR